MAQVYTSASSQFINSDFFRKGVRTGDFTEIEHQLNRYIELYHQAVCISAQKTYGLHRLSTDQIIKPALRNLPMAKVEFYPRPATLKDKLGR